MGAGADVHTKVMVVHDHVIIAESLAGAIDAKPDLSCVATAHSGTDAVALAEDLGPNVVVVDTRLGDDDGVATTAILTGRHPELRVVLLAAHVDPSLVRSAAAAGACWLLGKNRSLVDLFTAIRWASRTGFTVHPDLLRALVTAVPTAAAKESTPPNATGLTAREFEVLGYLELGWDARRIAKALGISLNTTRGYVRSLLSKLGAHSQLEAMANARRMGLVGGVQTR